jgi:hypothetical protein
LAEGDIFVVWSKWDIPNHAHDLDNERMRRRMEESKENQIISIEISLF